MAYNIILAEDQAFSPGAEAISNPDWDFSLDKIHIKEFVAAATPAPIELDIIIKDFPRLKGESLDYLQPYIVFYAKADIDFGIKNKSAKEFFSIAGNISSNAEPGYEIGSADLNVSETITFLNFQSLLPGTYTAVIKFEVYGETEAEEMVLIETKIFEISIDILSYNQIDASKAILLFNQVIDDDLPAAQTFNITATGVYSLKTPYYIDLAGSDLDFEIEEDGIKTYYGVGSQEVSVTINEDLPEGEYSDFITIENEDGGSTTLEINHKAFAALPVFLLDKTELNFTTIQGVEPQIDSFIAFNLGNNLVTLISKPFWLNVGLENIIPNGICLIKVLPINLISLKEGTYTGKITVECGGVQKSVIVTLEHIFNVKLNLNNSGGINFTDDHSTISKFFNTDIHDVLVRITMYLPSYMPVVFENKNISLVAGMFNKKSNLFIGRSIKNIMYKLRNLTDLGFYFLPAPGSFSITPTGYVNGYLKVLQLPTKANIQVRFVNRTTGSNQSVSNYDNFHFLKGRRPLDFKFNHGILCYDNLPSRVTQNSVVLFNFYASIPVKIICKRNGAVAFSGAISPQANRVFHYRLYFNSFQPGDVIEVMLDAVSISVIDMEPMPSRKYIVFPEGEESYHIGFVNEYNVLETMEFTGAFTYTVAYESRIVKTYLNFLEQLEKIDSKKGQKLVCNTGPILKVDAKKIDLMIDSKQAFLMFREDKQPLNLIPINKTLVNQDSMQEIYEYDVEFEINRDNDTEIYPR